MQCVLTQFKEQLIDGEKAKKLLADMDYDADAKLLQKNEKA